MTRPPETRTAFDSPALAYRSEHYPRQAFGEHETRTPCRAGLRYMGEPSLVVAEHFFGWMPHTIDAPAEARWHIVLRRAETPAESTPPWKRKDGPSV